MKNKQRGFIIPLLIVIIAVMAIGGGAYIYTVNKEKAALNIDTSANQNTNQKASSTATVKAEIKSDIKIPVPVSPVPVKPVTQVYTNSFYSFSYPGTWSVWEANHAIGLTILYPTIKESKVFDKTISTTDEITVSIFSPSSGGDLTSTFLSGAVKANVRGETWFIKNVGMTDGGSENGIEYYKQIQQGQNRWISIFAGESNRRTLEELVFSFNVK